MPPERPERDPATLLDIDRAAGLAQSFMAGLTREQFETDEKTQAAVLQKILIIGEAVKRLSGTFRQAHPEIPWKQIARMRDILIHDYDRVDLDEVWRAVRSDLPDLRARLAPLLARTGDGPPSTELTAC